MGERRSQELTEALVYAADTGMLWDQYGIVGDVPVSKSHGLFYQLINCDPSSHLLQNSLGQTSTT